MADGGDVPGALVLPVPVGGVEVDPLAQAPDGGLGVGAQGGRVGGSGVEVGVDEAEDVQAQGVVGVDGQGGDGALGAEPVACAVSEPRH
jgi:hypothetical protein